MVYKIKVCVPMVLGKIYITCRIQHITGQASEAILDAEVPQLVSVTDFTTQGCMRTHFGTSHHTMQHMTYSNTKWQCQCQLLWTWLLTAS